MKKYKIGYTTGVFDLFHIGHLNILKRAKEQCEHLIVGISTDELVQAYKHKTPIIPFEERKEIVKSIKFVDQVVPQTSMDKFQAWKNLNFNVVFVGSDWQGTKKWQEYEKQFGSVGVEVVYFPYTKGTSSTMLRSVLQQVLEDKSLVKASY